MVILGIFGIIVIVLFFLLVKFTNVKEGTAIAVTSFGGFQKIIFQWKDHWMDEEWNIWKKDEKVGKEKSKEKKIKGHIFGGLWWYGFLLIHTIHQYNSRWTDLHMTKEGKMGLYFHEEPLSHVLLKPAVYALQLFAVETAPPERIPVDVMVLVTMRIGNPYNFLFIAPPTPIEDILARTSALMREVITGRTVDELLKIRGESLWTETEKEKSVLKGEEESVLKGAKLIEDTLQKWGLKLADKGIEIKDITLPPEYQKAAAARRAEEMKAEARAAETVGAVIASMARIYGKKVEEMPKIIEQDPALQKEFLKESNDLIIRKLGMENDSYVDIRVQGAEGIERTILNALAAWQRMPKGRLEEEREKSEKKTRRVKMGGKWIDVEEE